jgi:RNA polymerase sigma-70 factor (ECF subfamily)
MCYTCCANLKVGMPVIMSNAPDDGICVARCLRGDTSAFEPLVERYQRVLFGVAYRLLGDYEEARDATQNAFVKAFERLETFDPSRKFFSWLYRIAVNECLNILRARRPHEELETEIQVEAGLFEAAEASELRDRIQAALLKLSEDYRQVVVLRHFADLSYEEIGAIVGVPVKTVKSRLFTARQRLADLLVLPERKRP